MLTDPLDMLLIVEQDQRVGMNQMAQRNLKNVTKLPSLGSGNQMNTKAVQIIGGVDMLTPLQSELGSAQPASKRMGPKWVYQQVDPAPYPGASYDSVASEPELADNYSPSPKQSLMPSMSPGLSPQMQLPNASPAGWVPPPLSPSPQPHRLQALPKRPMPGTSVTMVTAETKLSPVLNAAQWTPSNDVSVRYSAFNVKQILDLWEMNGWTAVRANFKGKPAEGENANTKVPTYHGRLVQNGLTLVFMGDEGAPTEMVFNKDIDRLTFRVSAWNTPQNVPPTTARNASPVVSRRRSSGANEEEFRSLAPAGASFTTNNGASYGTSHSRRGSPSPQMMNVGTSHDSTPPQQAGGRPSSRMAPSPQPLSSVSRRDSSSPMGQPRREVSPSPVTRGNPPPQSMLQAVAGSPRLAF